MTSSPTFTEDLARCAALSYVDEDICVARILAAAHMSPDNRMQASARARRWVESIRQSKKAHAGVTDLLSRFGLTSQEGLALMCLAEALLRIPDSETADALIRDKLGDTRWLESLGDDAPWSINATGWALATAGKFVDLQNEEKTGLGATLGRAVARLGQPVMREAIRHAMQWMADQFVMGETIVKALDRARPMMEKGVRFSFDMLGEGARTMADAERYMEQYRTAIERIGQFQAEKKYPRVSGISVKLSALHPRYEMAQRERVMQELVPKLVDLCELAAHYAIPLTIDAEEADRLHLSLEVVDASLRCAELGTWDGFGLAVQAYQKRAPAVIDTIAHLAKTYRRRIHIRLVKGAYWDTEIKRAQERGLDNYPVFTRKATTDVSYIACARRILEAGDLIQPIFGTHNALTVAQVLAVAQGRDATRIEFQRLHGMGAELHGLMHQEGIGCCIYAPVGDHDVLLSYLVRRLLENGANSSFVHRIFDPAVPVESLIQDPVAVVRDYGDFVRNPVLPRVTDVYEPSRRNSSGLDLSDPFVTDSLLRRIEPLSLPPTPMPTDTQAVDGLFESAGKAHSAWAQTPVETRAVCLEKLSGLLEKNHDQFMGLLIREGGKTIPDAVAEIREAVDFCHYYARRARLDFAPMDLPGPTGERNRLRLVGRGVFVCISPWNFPLAIFLGQVIAALVAGNSVIAKPAPQTPRIAALAVQLMHESGIPAQALHLALGGAEIGVMLVRHPCVAGVAFTGSMAAARTINQALAVRAGAIVPLIAETGGQNAMIVDSSALHEQVVDDVIISCFRSAGQRCSALRILCLPDATADAILTMLKGAMTELRVGDPMKLATDVGPVIDAAAQQRLQKHIERLRREAREIFTVPLDDVCQRGLFVAPQVWGIPSIDWLEGEVFGPILHVVRYAPGDFDAIVRAINATGFGLTAGVHSRIDRFVNRVERDLKVGNLYVNRSMIGAVVGAQPFGGEGSSGTGPKAGGPHYLPRFATERVTSVNTTAAGGNVGLLASSS